MMVREFFQKNKDRFFIKHCYFFKALAFKAYIFFDRKRKKILITGCGYSGTGYVSKLLTQMGFPIGHEQMSRFGVAAWPLAVDSLEYMPHVKFRRCDYPFHIILHQVRNPLAVIGSAHSADNLTWNYIEKFVPINRSDSLLKKCMKYWYYWNLSAEKSAIWTYQIESLEKNFEVFCQKLKRPKLAKRKKIFFELKKTVNTHQNQKGYRAGISWHDIEIEDKELCLKIKSLARKYGYSVDEG